MHQLFTIDYLVHEICSRVPHSQLPVLACVSSTWFRCAVSLLYEGGVNLEKVVLPFRNYIIDIYGYRVLADSLSNDSFMRFSKYAPYVQELSVDTRSTSIALDMMGKSRSRGIPHLFPNARRLNWTRPEHSKECMEVAVDLISSKIDALSLYINDAGILRYLHALMLTRISALHSLVIQDETNSARIDSGNYIESSLMQSVKNLFNFFTHSLTSVHISLSLNSPSIAELLSKMPNLCKLTIAGGGVSKEVSESNRICGLSESFPSLHSFSFGGSPQSFHHIYSSPYSMASLITLTLNAAFSPTDVHRFVLSIVEASPHLRSLSIGDRHISDPLTYTWPVVPWPSIQPLSCCPKLTSISLHWMRVSVDLDKLVNFLESRTGWKRLHILTSVPLHLQDMLLYAKHCRNLVHLGIYINDSTEFFVKDLPMDLPTFSTLDSIDFADSNITESASSSLAQLLCRICKTPPSQIKGFSESITNDVLRSLAVSYVKEQSRTRILMSNEVEEFIMKMLAKKN